MKKLFPDNPHHDNYSEELGWEYLGTDDKYDYYVNHVSKWLSIVYGHKGHEYESPCYRLYKKINIDFEMSEILHSPAQHKLYELLTNQKG